MKKHNKCTKCKRIFSRHGLIRLRKDLYCNNCFLSITGRMPMKTIKVDSRPLKQPKKLNEDGDDI